MVLGKQKLDILLGIDSASVWNCTGEMNSILSKDNPLARVLMVVESPA